MGCVRRLKRAPFGLCWLLTLLTACVTPVQAPVSEAPVVLPYSLQSMAFDGTDLWQVIADGDHSSLLQQSLAGKELRRVALNRKLPGHRSLAWGRAGLWMLDADNQLYAIDLQGQVGQPLALPLAEARIAEQIVWAGDELWLLTSRYVNAAGELVPSRFYRLDPADGKLLAERAIADPPVPGQTNFYPFSSFFHQNLSADAQAFYVARGNIFDKPLNVVYRIDRASGEVTRQPLERIYTGIGTSFWYRSQLYGIELLDTANCGEYCRGQLEKLIQAEEVQKRQKGR